MKNGKSTLTYIVAAFSLLVTSATSSVAGSPTGIICTPGSWEAGADLPSPGVRMVGVFFPNARFYGLGGRSSDVGGSDFVHPFEYDPFANTWTTKAATYPDNEVDNMACGILTDSGTNISTA